MILVCIEEQVESNRVRIHGLHRTTAFTGLRPVEARKTENPPAATPVQRFVRRIVKGKFRATRGQRWFSFSRTP